MLHMTIKQSSIVLPKIPLILWSNPSVILIPKYYEFQGLRAA